MTKEETMKVKNFVKISKQAAWTDFGDKLSTQFRKKSEVILWNGKTNEKT